MKAIGIIGAIEAIAAGPRRGVFLHSERRTSFPEAVQAPAPWTQAALTTPVPVNFDVGADGGTTTAALTRGGAARVTASAARPGNRWIQDDAPDQRTRVARGERPQSIGSRHRRAGSQ